MEPQGLPDTKPEHWERGPCKERGPSPIPAKYCRAEKQIAPANDAYTPTQPKPGRSRKEPATIPSAEPSLFTVIAILATAPS